MQLTWLKYKQMQILEQEELNDKSSKLKKGRKFGAVRTCPRIRAIKVKMNFAKIISTLHAA